MKRNRMFTILAALTFATLFTACGMPPMQQEGAKAQSGQGPLSVSSQAYVSTRNNNVAQGESTETTGKGETAKGCVDTLHCFDHNGEDPASTVCDNVCAMAGGATCTSTGHTWTLNRCTRKGGKPGKQVLCHCG
ncbi:MAG: hypothetical protein EP343_09460 [Deltaproteobacteria bacterium]|nr:MAG: hypothetical protein EP343_09460 [Deltaproteobacteria bacterium]